MMQQPEKRVARSRKYALKALLRFAPQIIQIMRSKPSSEQFKHNIETFITNLRNDGALPNEGIRLMEAMIATAQEIHMDRETYHKIDTYLIGGMGVVSLVLLQILVSIGHPDIASSIYWIAIAFPCTAGFLLLSFLKKEYHVPGYGSLPEKVAFITLLAGFISVEALFWHVWIWAGIVFLPFVFALLILTSLYKFFVVFPKHFFVPEPNKASEKQLEENTQ